MDKLKLAFDYLVNGPKETRDIEPDRYLNSLGEPIEGGILKKLWRNHAAVTAVGCAVVAGHLGMKNIDNARNMLVTTMCIYLLRRDNKQTYINHFDKHIIIDTKPEDGMRTHADDLRRSQMLIPHERFNVCLSGTVACLEFVVPSGGIFPYIFLALTSGIAQPLRAQGKIVSKEWVIVPPGEMKKRKPQSQLNFT